jgi:hypothetical protein
MIFGPYKTRRNHMKLKVQLTLEDYRKWHFDFLYGNMRRGITIAGLTVFFACLGFYFVIATSGGRTVSTGLIYLALFIVFLVIFIPASLYFRTKKHFESDKLIQEEQDYQIDEKGVKAKSEYGSSDIPWDKVYGAHLNKKYITIALSISRMFLLPARFFEEGQMQELGELLKGVLPKGKVKGKV